MSQFDAVCFLPLYRDFSTILIWPAAEDESSTYEVWSDSTDIPPDYRSSEVMMFGVPMPSGKNHHYVAIRSEQFNPSYAYYTRRPDTSVFKTSVKDTTFRIQEILPR